MAVALLVVPGIALAWLWVAPPRGRLAALRQLLAGGAAMAVVGLAWPLLVTLTPAADRPWISRHRGQQHLVADLQLQRRRPASPGQTGAPGAGFGGGGGGGAFGGATGVVPPARIGPGRPGRLAARVRRRGRPRRARGVTRLRRSDPRTGWLIAVGGAFLVSAVVFSYASGIFHPYYVSFLAPFTAVLIGAGVGEALLGRPGGRVIAVPAGDRRRGGHRARGARQPRRRRSRGPSRWSSRVGGRAARSCWRCSCPRALRAAVMAVALAALLAAPATWAAETIGHATSRHVPGRRARQRAERRLRRAGRAGGVRRVRPAGAPSASRAATPAAAGFARPWRLRGSGVQGLFTNPQSAQPASGAASARRRLRRRRLRRPAASAAPGGGGAFGGNSASLNAARALRQGPRRRRHRRREPEHAPRPRSWPTTPTSPASAGSPVARAR